jgi:hypothetical protein
MRLPSAVLFLALTGVACAQTPAGSSPTTEPVPATSAALQSESPASNNTLLPEIPPLPKGSPTVVGGTIDRLDRVRDQLVVRAFGSRQTFKIMFDERSQVFRDGKLISVRDLRPAERVSVETVTDGTGIFAKSIHVRSAASEAECRGQVLRFDAETGELMVRDGLSPRPVKLTVGSATTITGGQAVPKASIADLKEGTLITAAFTPDASGHRIVHHVEILATQGGSFTFAGSIAYLDLGAGVLVVTDPRDNKSYDISFEPARMPVSRQLREGADVTVTADFNGTHYVARDIALTPSRQ